MDCIKKKGCIEMQPKIKNATLQPNATRIKNCVCSQNKNPSDECRWDFFVLPKRRT